MKNIQLLILFTLIPFVSCSGTFKHTLDFSPNEPLRVAVLPFKHIDSDGKIIEDDGSLLVDNVSLISSEVKNSPVALSRKIVLAELKKTSLDIISPVLIDIDLPHRNLAFPDGKFNLEKIFSVPAKTYCEDFLDCDAVLFGTVKKWDRSYYGLQSNNEVEIELSLISAKTNKILFQATANDSEGHGLSKGPTGYASVILEPLKGLDSELIEDLARRTIAKMLEPLRSKESKTKDTTPPPAIFAVSHDAINGEIIKGSPLTVLAFADSDKTASFTIGNYVRNVPMIETKAGHYIGEFWPLPEEKFEAQSITITLKDSNNRITKLVVDSGPVSLK